jgi:hypothetical protein
VADPALYNAILEENKAIQDTIQEVGLNAALAALESEPWNTDNWDLLPLLENPTGCLCVYDSSSGYLRCNACCLWTVPGGATKVQFQIWGAGGGTANGQCCAGNPFGQTGAYATVIIDAVPGCQYTLCAGCAYCCYACCNSTNYTTGCASYVTGFGLSNFCAMGGRARTSCRMRMLHGGSYSQCRWRGNGSSDGSGPCLCCSGSWYCFDNSCATCGIIPFTADTEQVYYGSADTGTVYGLPSIGGGGCLDRNNYGYHTHPPLISPCHTCQTSSCCCQTFSSGSCCGGCRCTGATGTLCYPGAGGFGTHMMGGATAWSGDSGRGGMVRVTWC